MCNVISGHQCLKDKGMSFQLNKLLAKSVINIDLYRVNSELRVDLTSLNRGRVHLDAASW